MRAALVEGGRRALLATVFARTLLTGIAAATTGSWCRFREAFDAALAQEAISTPRPRRRGRGLRRARPAPGRGPACTGWPRPGSGGHADPRLPRVAEAGLERGGVTPLVERSLSSEVIRAWKPSREVYLWAAGVCDVAPDRMALVAAHGWDVLGAQRAGLTGAWFPRHERVYPAVYAAPHVTAPDLSGVVDALLALPSGT